MFMWTWKVERWSFLGENENFQGTYLLAWRKNTTFAMCTYKLVGGCGSFRIQSFTQFSAVV